MSMERRNAAARAARASGIIVLMALTCTDARPEPARAGARAEDAAAPRTLVAEVSDSKALGYVGNRKFLIDSRGTMYCAVRGCGPRFTGICLLRSTKHWPEADGFDSAWLEDRPGVEVSSAPQRAASIALGGDGSIHLVWYGGTALAPAHQIRYARFAAGGAPRLLEESEPFPVAGFERVYLGPLTGDELWQEHPCIASTPDGRVQLVWEARDPSRLNAQGGPQPGIAAAVRDTAGNWSASGPLAAPPYLQVDAHFPSQSRPTLAAGPGGALHVICYGSVGGVQQILRGVLRDGTFSGWSVVAPSPGDQRHVSAACEASGRVHIAWREGPVSGAGAGPIAVYYASLDPEGRVAGPVRVSPAGENASTPSVVANGTSVWVAWVAWTPGELNSEGRRDNGYPADNAAVEGRLEIRSARSGTSSFGPVTQLEAGPVSYPTWASRTDQARAPEALIWTRIEQGSKYRLMLTPVAGR